MRLLIIGGSDAGVSGHFAHATSIAPPRSHEGTAAKCMIYEAQTLDDKGQNQITESSFHDLEAPRLRNARGPFRDRVVGRAKPFFL